MVDVGNIHGLNLGPQPQQPGPDPHGADGNVPPEAQPAHDAQNEPQPTDAAVVAAMVARMAELEAQLALFQAGAQPVPAPAPNPAAMLQQQAQYAAAAAAGSHTNIPDVTVGQLAPVDLTCE